MLGLLLLVIFFATGTTSPATQPSTRPAPDWIDDPAGWSGFALDPEDQEYARRTAPAHVKRWREFRQLEMTPVTDEDAFLAALSSALKREAVFIAAVPAANFELRDPLPTTRPSPPDGPMDDALFASLASAVQDAWVVLQDRPFEEQQARYFAGRVARIEAPDADGATIEHRLGERVDTTNLDEAQIWDYLRRLYEQRVKAYGGDFNLRAAALESPRGIACQIFYSEPGKYEDGLLMARGNPAGNGWDDYWRAGLIVCARQFTHPPASMGQLIERDGRVLRADVQTVLEMNNGERAPMLLSLFYEPQERRWWVMSSCFSSSPFLGEVGQAR